MIFDIIIHSSIPAMLIQMNQKTDDRIRNKIDDE